MVNRIVVDPYEPKSIDEAIKEIKKNKQDLQKKAKMVCKRLAEVGLSVARIYFIPEAWSGNADVTLTVEPMSNGYKLVADGEDVLFMEFGAGVTAGLGYDTKEIAPPVDISIGSWSREHSGPFWKTWQKNPATAHWYYNGRAFDGIAPQMGMYHASKESKAQIEKVVKEVFKP